MTKASQRSTCSDSTGRPEEMSEEECSWWLSDDLSQITGGTTRHSVSKALQENQKRGSMDSKRDCMRQVSHRKPASNPSVVDIAAVPFMIVIVFLICVFLPMASWITPPGCEGPRWRYS
ncbi:unnamed protein product [Symbiodinium sp. CCMP2456]|nr:unnamed protein product [Symbiodinium sp. CCMP2456]